MKENKQITKRNAKGITPIALVITIIVLLILAGISIRVLTGDNGIIRNASNAKNETDIASEREVLQQASVQVMGNNPNGNIEKEELQEELDKKLGEGKTDIDKIGDDLEVFFTETNRTYLIDENGVETLVTNEENTAQAPQYWEKTNKNDEEWYSYADISAGNKEVRVNEPKLRGAITPIKYVGEDKEEQIGSKWANVITQDGSMWVWIPRYAYKITSGYHEGGTETTGGTIEVAFIDKNNNFLNGETGTIVTNPYEVTYTENEEGEKVQNEWLVHPAFTSEAEYGGGFGELTGIWVGKFETTGDYDSETDTGNISVLPGSKNNMGRRTANQYYQLAKSTTFGEKIRINNHMAKNSEWGAIIYLAQSKYGVNGNGIEKNSNGTETGGNTELKTIYITNKAQSTTNNAYGIYDLNGGLWEIVASYIDADTEYALENFTNHGGFGQAGSFIGKNATEKSTSTAYKTVYKTGGYAITENVKGDAIWETSGATTTSWFKGKKVYPYDKEAFFYRGDCYFNSDTSVFAYHREGGSKGPMGQGTTFRCVLAF